MQAAQERIAQGWEDVAQRRASTTEQRQAIDELELELEAQLVDSGRIVQERGAGGGRGGYVVRDGEGQLVDRTGSLEAAVELAEQVHEDSRGAAERARVGLTEDAAQRLEALQTQEPVVIESGGLPTDLELARKQLVDAFPSRAVFTNRATGRSIRMVNRVRGKLRSHSANLRTLKIIPALQKIVESALPLFESSGKGKRWHYYGAAASIDGEAVFVRLAAFETREGQLVIDYLHDVQTTPREIIEGSLFSDGSEKTNKVGGGSDPLEGSTAEIQSSRTKQDGQGGEPSRDKLVQWVQAVKSKGLAEAQSSVAASDAGAVSGVAGGVEAVQESPLGVGRANAQRVSFESQLSEADAGKRPVDAPSVLRALGEVVEAVGGDARALNRVGRMGARARRAAGFFHPWTHITRIRTANDIPVAAHELAHALDVALWEDGAVLGLTGKTHWQRMRGLHFGAFLRHLDNRHRLARTSLCRAIAYALARRRSPWP